MWRGGVGATRGGGGADESAMSSDKSKYDIGIHTDTHTCVHIETCIYVHIYGGVCTWTGLCCASGTKVSGRRNVVVVFVCIYTYVCYRPPLQMLFYRARRHVLDIYIYIVYIISMLHDTLFYIIFVCVRKKTKTKKMYRQDKNRFAPLSVSCGSDVGQ